MSDQAIKIGGTYRHYKNKLYKVHDIAVHSETLEKLVFYECLYENDLGRMWVRPIDNFTGLVEINGKTVKRFQLID